MGVTGVVGVAHWSCSLSAVGRFFVIDVPRTSAGIALVLGRIRRNLLSLGVVAVDNLRNRCSGKPSAVEAR